MIRYIIMNENQLFASSDRVTFNARKESMFLAAT